jgi:peptidoglycan hydrolase-like protein with peptidoglycan-binding domain
MELKHLTIAVAAALGLSTAAMAQSGDMGKRDTQSGAQSGMSTSQAGGMTASEDVRQVQQELQNRGYNVGAVDGVMGPQTKGALKEFQQAEGLPATGDLNQQTKKQLMSQGSGSGSGASSTTGASGRGSASGSSASGSTQGGTGTGAAGSSRSGSGTTGSSSPGMSGGSSPGTTGSSSGSGTTGSGSSSGSGTTGSASGSGTGATGASPSGAGGMNPPSTTAPRPGTDKPKTGDSSK